MKGKKQKDVLEFELLIDHISGKKMVLNLCFKYYLYEKMSIFQCKKFIVPLFISFDYILELLFTF